MAELDSLLLNRARGDSSPVIISAVSGTAGVGKTALAVHWAHNVRKHFTDGDLYINLRGFDPEPKVTADEALDRFLRALGVEPKNIPANLDERASMYRSVLAERRILLLLDNAADLQQVALFSQVLQIAWL